MYFDYQTNLNGRLISGSNVRVGITAQSYPFPAPSGVADFSLRLPGAEALASAVLGYGPFGGARMELDAQLPVTDTLAVAAGGGIVRDEQYYGGGRWEGNAAVIGRWRPSDSLELIPFWSVQDNSSDEAQPIIFTDGAFLPPRIERRRYFGPEWAQKESRGANYGLLATYRFAEWTLRGARSVLLSPTFATSTCSI